VDHSHAAVHGSALDKPGKAEIAFAVVDQYQGQGIGAALMHHLAAIAQTAGLEELIAEVLPDNLAMLKVFEKSGFPRHQARAPSRAPGSSAGLSGQT
jgi:ribosomal protein S18 acetylase RimI-like enzyme